MAALKHAFPVLDHCTLSSLRVLTRREMFKAGLLGGAGAAGAAALGSVANLASAESASEQCTNLVPAAAGGPMPSDRDVISLRWLGCACFELAYRNQVILLDTWYDRPLCRDIGLTPQQVVRADTIFIGHAHFDHIADAASIALRTGATVVADQTVGTGVLLSQGVPANQIRSVNGLGGELLQFNGFTVQPILAHHSVLPSSLNSESETAGQEINDAYLALTNPPFTSADLAASLAVVGRGSFDPRILTQGTIAYLFTFDSGYRMVWLDSAGPITPYLQAAMEKLKSTNLAIVGYTAQGFPRFQVPVTLSLIISLTRTCSCLPITMNSYSRGTARPWSRFQTWQRSHCSRRCGSQGRRPRRFLVCTERQCASTSTRVKSRPARNVNARLTAQPECLHCGRQSALAISYPRDNHPRHNAFPRHSTSTIAIAVVSWATRKLR